ncbi:glycosyltransferase family 4 protein [Dyella telluris]|uniref:Glycosyltransferase family 4 protein n=1 Tax=Dyella telluris TaxID=2763498 RepID=A0A7G8Q0R4_9GAMM|nr:glycosyltransferase family 4 protein [Dyella telluris]QNK00372.1 glycosyltransferase family 4 protein [Dyella telluris]
MVEHVDTRSRAMLVTRNFPPLLGGMERLNQHLLESLAKVWRTSMCGPAGSARFASTAEEVREVAISPLSAFLVKSLWFSWRMAIRQRPEWIVAGSGLMAPIAWLSARRSRAKVAVYLHGLDIIAPSVIYRWLWLPFIRRCDVALVNSRATMALALEKGVPSERISVVNPGAEIPEFDPQRAARFRAAYDLGDAPLMLSVGRLTRRKGLAEFVAKALPVIVAAKPDAVLLIVGDEARNALHGGRGGEKDHILRVANEVGVKNHILFLGHCSEEDLHAAYEASDVHVFPVLSLPGDVEGFGMVALEAAAHGLPSVAFDAGGVSDAIEPGITGDLVTQGAYDELASRVLIYMNRTGGGKRMPEGCLAFARSKAWTVFAQKSLAALGR